MLIKTLVCVIVLALGYVATGAHADEFDAVSAKLEAAIKSEVRTESDIERDANRLPVETLRFMRLRDDMKVVELLPGSGWYTKLLAPVLAERGHLILALGTGRVEDGLLDKSGFGKVKVTAKDASFSRPDGSYYYQLKMTSLGVSDADLVLTFRNYHNFDAPGRAKMNRAAFKALKPGGIYGLVDHSRRHMQQNSPENRRRMDPVLAIREIQAVGFVFEDFSDLHYRADDELRYEVGRRSVTGNTDRWTMRFRKPL